MDSLAQEGVRLTMHYVTNPPCSPSRCSLITGMYAQRFYKFAMARGLPEPSRQSPARKAGCSLRNAQRGIAATMTDPL